MIIVLLLILCLGSLSAQNLNTDEKQFLSLLNEARNQPKAFAQKYVLALMKEEEEEDDEIDPTTQAFYEKLQKMSPRRSLGIDAGTQKAANDALGGKLDASPSKYNKEVRQSGGSEMTTRMEDIHIIIENEHALLDPDYTHLGIRIEKADKSGNDSRKICYFLVQIGDVERQLERNYQRKYPQLQNPKWDDKKLNTAAAETYMSAGEKAMILEINKVRQNPKAYIAYIEDYLIEMSNKWGLSLSELEAANSLIEELYQLPPMSILQPKRCVYNAARLHGIDQQKNKFSGHTGSDDSDPWDRILKSCKGELNYSSAFNDKGLVGNENLVGGSPDAGRSLIQLLIDAGIPGYGHRKNIIDPKWNFIGCFYVGQIEDISHNWVQNFAQ